MNAIDAIREFKRLLDKEFKDKQEILEIIHEIYGDVLEKLISD